MRRSSLLEEWVACEKKQTLRRIQNVTAVIMIVIFSITAVINIRAKEPETRGMVEVTREHIYSPDGYEMYFTTITAEKGDTIEGTSRELLEKFQLEEICSLRDYELVFFQLNKTVYVPSRDFKSGKSYIWPYWVPIEDEETQ